MGTKRETIGCWTSVNVLGRSHHDSTLRRSTGPAEFDVIDKLEKATNMMMVDERGNTYRLLVHREYRECSGNVTVQGIK